jgi:hypothetical protein
MLNSILILPAQLFYPFSSNGRQTVGDGAFYVDAAPSVLAVCHLQGEDDMYYYSTTFSGGPGVRTFTLSSQYRYLLPFQWRF